MEDTFRPFAATSRGISERNPFGILISGGNLSRQSMGLHGFGNNGKSRSIVDFGTKLKDLGVETWCLHISPYLIKML